jgi:hypothetical protein
MLLPRSLIYSETLDKMVLDKACSEGACLKNASEVLAIVPSLKYSNSPYHLIKIHSQICIVEPLIHF